MELHLLMQLATTVQFILIYWDEKFKKYDRSNSATDYIYDVKICIICNMLSGNRPHEISMCLDLTPENVATVTDVIRYEYAHEPRTLGASCCWSPTLRTNSSWLERQRYAAPGWQCWQCCCTLVTHSYRSGFSREQGCDYVYDDVLYMLAWINACNDELFQSKWKINYKLTMFHKCNFWEVWIFFFLEIDPRPLDSQGQPCLLNGTVLKC